MKTPPPDIDAYIGAFDQPVIAKLEQVRQAVKKAVPKAEEVISYSMPAFKYKGRILLYFAAFKHHVGFYPMSSAINQFKASLDNYTWAKGSVQFPLDQPIPVKLVTQMAKFRADENEAIAERKAVKKKG